MGTAATRGGWGETLGLALPGNAATPAADSGRLAPAEMPGRRAVEMALGRGPKPSEILPAAAYDADLGADGARGGSPSAIVHLVALCGRGGVPLPMRRFDELSRTTPLLANVRPSGKHLMEDFYYAGGVPAVLRELLPMLDGNTLAVNGKTLRENVADAPCHDSDIIRPLSLPLSSEGGTVILTGNLCPGGAVLEQSAASPHLMVHRGRAVVFEDHQDLERRIDDPSLPIDENSVLVLKQAGPKGGPGMPEWGAAPVPARLLKAGVKDLVRISDARMSGTSYGTVVLHVTPESAVGGPLVDQHALGSQTSPRAAGLTSKADPVPTMARLRHEACEAFERFESEMGRTVSFHRSGSLRAAYTDAAVERVRIARETAGACGIEARVIDTAEAERLAPHFKPGAARAILHVPSDGWVDPAKVAIGFATRAGELGARLLPFTPVQGLLGEGGRAAGVMTPRGEIRAPVVVDAAGGWTARVAAGAGGPMPPGSVRQPRLLAPHHASAEAAPHL